MTGHTHTTLAEEYHKLTDHGADGCGFGAGLCNCEQVVKRVRIAEDALLRARESARDNARRAVYVNPDTGKAHRLGVWSEKGSVVTASSAVCGWHLGGVEPTDDGESWCKVCYPEKAAS